MTTVNIEALKVTREHLTKEIIRQHNKVVEYRRKFTAAQRAHTALSGQHAIIDRQIFEIDPGVTVVKPFLMPSPAPVRKAPAKPVPVTADSMKSAIGAEMLEKMLQAAIAKKKENAGNPELNENKP